MEGAAQAALSYLDPECAYDEWVRLGMALHDGLGHAGWPIWAAWSAQSPKWNERAAKTQWRSFRAGRGIGIGTLFHAARQRGWTGNAPPQRLFRPRRLPRTDRRSTDAEIAAERARHMIINGFVADHPYLDAKGFPDHAWLQFGHDLIVPARKWPATRSRTAVQSCQRISPDGAKRFLRHGIIRGCAFTMGPGPDTGRSMFLCEGFATALSVQSALNEIGVRRGVATCFSAHGLCAIARRYPRALVIGDCDDSGAGQRAAKASGRPYWIPHEPGDANDLHQSHGIEAVITGVRRLFASRRIARG